MQARQRALANIQLIGHLYLKGMLAEKVMHGCVQTLLLDTDNPKAVHAECLAKLMRIVGRQLEANPEAKLYMNVYFSRVAMISMDVRLGSHIRRLLPLVPLLPQ